MPEIKPKDILSFSSEDRKHPAENLLKREGTSKWKCKEGEKQASVTFQFEKASEIQQIDIGNEGSAFVEVLVARGNDDFQVILGASAFMTPIEAKNGTNANKVRILGLDKLNKTVSDEKWDRVKAVCTQPFNRKSSYGLSFIKFHSKPDPNAKGDDGPPKPITKQTTLGAFKLKEDKSDGITTGSLFAKRNKGPENPSNPLTGAAAIRAASKLAEESTPAVTAIPSTSNWTPNRRLSAEDKSRPKTPEATKPSLRKQSTSVSSVASAASSKKDTPILKQSKTEPPKKKARPFDQIMKKVVFCLSGYQNPERGKIRDKALEMGASYKPDWGRGCTHLICAYDNTPKYNQVSGKGRIVTRKWMDDCYRRQELLPWRKYRLGDAESPGETSESEEDDEEKPKVSSKRKAESPEPGPSSKKPALTKTGSNVSYGGETDEYDASTDEGGDTDDEIERVKASEKCEPVDPYDVPTDEEDNSNKNYDDPAGSGCEDSLPELPSFFKGKTFFLYGKFEPSERRTMFRFITAYDGSLVDYINDTVNYVITNSTWDENFDEALSDNPNLAFVKPTWIHACDEKQKMVPHQKYVIVPKL